MSLVAPPHYWDRRTLDYYMAHDTLNELMDMGIEDIDKRLNAIYKVLEHHDKAIERGEGTYLLSGVIRDEKTLNSIEEYRKLLFNLKNTETKKTTYTHYNSMGMVLREDKLTISERETIFQILFPEPWFDANSYDIDIEEVLDDWGIPTTRNKKYIIGPKDD